MYMTRLKMDKRIQIRSKRNRRRKQEKILVTLIIVVAVVLFVLIGVSILGKDKIKADEIEGLWIFDSSTSYEFASDNTGIMHIGQQNYPFSYRLSRQLLKIDFDSESIYDCVYEISIDGDMMTIEGKKGTTGGVYELAKKDLHD